jgi:poly-gamma-glutamate synthesis protein (capsule biosynthesis protein)
MGNTMLGDFTQSHLTQSTVLTKKIAPPTAASEPITLVFGGDVMLDRAVRNKVGPLDYRIFDDTLTDILSSADIAIINLEGPVTTLPSISAPAPFLAPESYSFTFEPASLNELQRAGIDIVSLGNNHIRDRGPEGTQQSQLHLTNHSLQYFGIPDTESTLFTRFEHEGMQFGFIAYNQFIPTVSDERFIELVGELASSTDFTVVFPHWGNEYETTPTSNQTLLAQAFIDAGADIVVGAHPHVIQTFETYNNRAIAYSLGNLIFDQWFEEPVRNGALLRVTIDPATRTYTTDAACTYLNRDATTASTPCASTTAASAHMQGMF